MRDNVILLRLPSAPRTASRALAPVLLAASLLGLTGCGGSSKHHTTIPSRPNGKVVRPASARRPLISIFEAPGQLITAPGSTLDELRRLGVQYVRVMVPWASVAPDPTSSRAPAGFDASSPSAYPASGWSTYDAIITAAAARGIGVQLNPTSPVPQWAVGPGEPAKHITGVWRPSASGFGQFVRALATRYSGHYTPPGASSSLPRVSFWSVWNEPNYGSDLAPQAVERNTLESSAIMYRRLLDGAWSALQQTGHGSDTILIGELAPTGITGPGFPGNFSGMVPLRFLRALYCVDESLHPLRGAAATARGCPASAAGSARFAAQHPALFDAGGMAVHPYSQGALAPNAIIPNQPDFSTLAALFRLERQLDAMTGAYGSSAHLALYSTEYGYMTNPPFAAGVPMALAPDYLNWAEYLSWLDPRIHSFDQYLLADPPASSPSQFDTGLEFAAGNPKPTLGAFRLPLYLPRTSAVKGQALEVWGCVRPARYATGPGADRAEIQFSPGAGKPFRTVQTVDVTPQDCYFDVRVAFPSSGLVQLAWAYPHGATIESRQVPVTIS